MQPCGTFNSRYKQDMVIVRTSAQWVMLGILFVALFVVIPRYASNHIMGMVSMIGITIIAVEGLNLLTGYCGQISLGQAAFVGVGAYTSAVLVTTLGLSFWIALPAAALVAGLIGLVFAFPAVRVKGFYLVLTTLAAQYIITFVLRNWRSVTGGERGLQVASATLGPITFNSERSSYFLIMAVTIVMVLLAKNIARTHTGRAFIAIRDNDLAAEVLGVNIFRYKMLGFFICSAFAGVAGSLFAHYTGAISFEIFSLSQSVTYLGMLIVGGLGSITGAIFGVVFLSLLDELMARAAPVLAEAVPFLSEGTSAGLGVIAFGVVIILFLIFEPRGLSHRWEVFKATYRIWPFSY